MSNLGPIELFIIVFVFVPTIWAIVDLIRRPPDQFPRFAKAGSSDKKGWIIALIVGWLLALGWVVAIVYLMMVRARMGPVRPGPASAPPGTPG